MMHYGTEMNASRFAVKRSLWSSVLEMALSVLVNTMSWKSISWTFTKLTPMMYYGTKMNALNFGVKRSKFKVVME